MRQALGNGKQDTQSPFSHPVGWGRRTSLQWTIVSCDTCCAGEARVCRVDKNGPGAGDRRGMGRQFFLGACLYSDFSSELHP